MTLHGSKSSVFPGVRSGPISAPGDPRAVRVIPEAPIAKTVRAKAVRSRHAVMLLEGQPLAGILQGAETVALDEELILFSFGIIPEFGEK